MLRQSTDFDELAVTVRALQEPRWVGNARIFR